MHFVSMFSDTIDSSYYYYNMERDNENGLQDAIHRVDKRTGRIINCIECIAMVIFIISAIAKWIVNPFDIKTKNSTPTPFHHHNVSSTLSTQIKPCFHENFTQNYKIRPIRMKSDKIIGKDAWISRIMNETKANHNHPIDVLLIRLELSIVSTNGDCFYTIHTIGHYKDKNKDRFYYNLNDENWVYNQDINPNTYYYIEKYDLFCKIYHIYDRLSVIANHSIVEMTLPNIYPSCTTFYHVAK